MPVWQAVKDVHKPTLLKNDFVLLCLGFGTTTRSCFLLIFFGLCTSTGAASFKIMSIIVVKFTRFEVSKFKFLPFTLHFVVRFRVEGQKTENA